jgi:site-specific DNA-cytosine methylase
MMIYKVLHLFCGIGGGALGFQNAITEYKGLVGRFETLAGIDCDPLACEDFERLTDAPAIQMDLFTRKDYIDFHGKEPPDGWREVTPQDLYRAAGDYPDVVFLSPPCKGFSGLLPSMSAATEKYQALNRLVARSMNLTMRAFEENLPSAILIENVPRITSRGVGLIKQVEKLLGKYGYVFDHQTHDCGEIGGLGQRRKRFLLIARNERKMPAFIYKPSIQRVKSIGEVIGPLPLPNDPVAGSLHRLPRLQWKTWVRLALIPAGGDWRDLQNIEPEKYRIEYASRAGTYGVMDWEQPGGTVTGNMSPKGSSAAAIPDPRMNLNSGTTHTAIYKVSRWEDTANTVTGAYRPNNGAVCIPDPRLQSCEGKHAAVYRVVRFDEPGPCVTGTRFGSGAPAISDPRINCQSRPKLYGVADWGKPISTVTGSASVTSSNGVSAIADPRLNCNCRTGTMGVMDWTQPGKTVTGTGDVHSGTAAIADPRIPGDTEAGTWIIIAEDGTWHRPLTTLELAALQSFPVVMADGSPLTLAGKSDARWREAIGNAVPPDAAQAIAEQIMPSLMASKMDEWFMSANGIWVSGSHHEYSEVDAL